MTPLSGIRVIDMARLGPGPHCAQILGDLGADVIKVEEPDPREGRRAGRVISLPSNSAIRRNSRSIGIDLKSEEGRDVFRRLVAGSDVLMEGFRPGVVQRLGADYETVRRLKPDIIYASLTGYGQDGPYAGYVGHDINYQAIAGILGRTGSPDGPPVIPGNTIADNAGGGLNAVIGILTALLVKERTGHGQYIDSAMVDGLLTMMFLNVDEYANTGHVPRRGETITTGLYPWYSVYEAADGKFVSVGAIEPWFYENLCRLLECDEYVTEQYADGARREEIFESFRRIFKTRPRDEWVSLLMPAETCVAPVYAIDEVVADPHLRWRKLIVDSPQPGGSARAEVGVMVKLSETPGEIRRAPPEPGQDTEELLREMGFRAQEIESLRQAGAVQ